MAEFRHVTMFYGQDGEAWCNFLLKYFQRPQMDLRLESLNIDELDYTNPPEITVSVKESYVIVMLITADLLCYMENHSDWFGSMLGDRDHQVTSILAAYLHVDYDDVMSVCNTKGYEVSDWKFVEIAVDGGNAQEIFTSILDCVDRNSENRHKKQMPMSNKNRSVFLPDDGYCEIFPRSVHEVGEKVVIIFKEEIAGQVTVKLSENQEAIMAVVTNPFCAVFHMPDLSAGKHTISILINRKIQAKCNLFYQFVTPSSLSLMMQVLGVNSREEMDVILADKFSKSSCNDSMLMSEFDESSSSAAGKHQELQYPTLVHWAAANGLKELCSQMLNSAAGVSACTILNCDTRSASDLARLNGHRELEEYINDFLETKQCADTCNLYIQFCGSSRNTEEPLYEDVPQGLSVSSSSFLPFDSNIKGPKLKPRNRSYSAPEPDIEPTEESTSQRAHKNLFKHIAEAAVGCRSQNELIEIMDEFKRGTFTISEAEMLFRSWKKRYQTGNACSFKDKQRSLQDIRQKNKSALTSVKTIHKKGFLTTHETIVEEEPIISISEPIIPRNPLIGGSSGRHLSRSSSGREASTASVNSIMSNDSGRESIISTLSEASELREDVMENWEEKRKSVLQSFLEFVNPGEDFGSPPPIPSRQRKPKVYPRPK